MSTLVEPPPDPIVISTPYGKVPADHYNRDLTPADISQMLVDIEAQASPGALVTEFILRWNMRKFTMQNFDDKRHYCLLNAAVATNKVELARFVYKHLSYDAKFYSLQEVEKASVKSAAMRDYLIKCTLQFEGDYDEDLKKIRRSLKALTF